MKSLNALSDAPRDSAKLMYLKNALLWWNVGRKIVLNSAGSRADVGVP